MIWVEWRLVAIYCVCLLLIGLAIFAFRAVRGSRGIVRIPVQIISIPVGLIGSLFLLLICVASGCITHSAPIYSPDQTMAVKVTDTDEGATGGGTGVQLFWYDGLASRGVFGGSWKSVRPSDVRWLDDSNLVICYRHEMYDCSSTRRVHVKCEPCPNPAN